MAGLSSGKRGASRNRGITTFGTPIEPHIAVIRDQYMVYLDTIQSVRKYCDNKDLTGQKPEWNKKTFGYVCIRPLCKTADTYLIPAEFSIVVFSFDEGVIEAHSGFIDPLDIPFTEQAELAVTISENGYPKPGLSSKDDYNLLTPGKFITMMINLANKFGLFMGCEFLLFTTRADIPVAHSCLSWIMAKAGQPKSPFHVISFEVLLMEMSSRVEPKDSPGIIKHEGGAGRFIYNPRYDFCYPLGCNWHKRPPVSEKVDKCANNIALRRVYNALFYLCHLFKRPIKMGSHCPYGYGDGG